VVETVKLELPKILLLEYQLFYLDKEGNSHNLPTTSVAKSFWPKKMMQ
jgi:hypothetical protein